MVTAEVMDAMATMTLYISGGDKAIRVMVVVATASAKESGGGKVVAGGNNDNMTIVEF